MRLLGQVTSLNMGCYHGVTEYCYFIHVFFFFPSFLTSLVSGSVASDLGFALHFLLGFSLYCRVGKVPRTAIEHRVIEFFKKGIHVTDPVEIMAVLVVYIVHA